MLKRTVCSAVGLLVYIACSLYAQDAKTILEKTGIKEGNCLVVDSSEALSLDLAKESKLRIYLVNPDQKRVDAMRLKIDKAEKYGQITCRQENPENILMPDYFFNLIVINRIQLDQRSFSEAYRLLRPGSAAVFSEKHDIKDLLKKTDAPGVKQTLVTFGNGIRILVKGHEPSNRYLKPPLTRLWVTCQALEKSVTRKRGSGDLPVRYQRSSRGDVVRSNCFFDVPVDVYNGTIYPPEKTYAKIELEEEIAPYTYHGNDVNSNYHGPFMRHHGTYIARDRITKERVWTFFDFGLYLGCCSPFFYANGFVYKSTHRNLLALDAHDGELVWQYRNGGNGCEGVRAARSILYQPNHRGFRMHAFISDIGWENRIPKGDQLTRKNSLPPTRHSTLDTRHSSDWPMFHHDAQRTGFSPDKTIRPPFKLLWRFKTGGMVRNSPAVVGNTVYAGSCDNKFYAIDAQTGKIKWQFFADDEIHSSPCVWGNSVYFGCDDGRVYALDRKTGRALWIYKTATRAALTPVFYTGPPWGYVPSKQYREWMDGMKQDRIMKETYSPARSFSPLCFNGQPLPTPGVVRSSPLVHDNVLCIGTGLGMNAEPCWGFLYALDAGTGKVLWKTGDQSLSERSEFAFGIANSPCFFRDRIHFSYGTYNAVDKEKGKLVFKGGSTGSSKGAGGESIPMSYAAPDSKRRGYWSSPLISAGSYLGVTVSGNVSICRKRGISLVSSGPFMYAVDADTGLVKWEGRYGGLGKVGNFYNFNRKTELSIGNINFHQPAALFEDRVFVGGGKGVAVFDILKGGKKGGRKYFKHSGYWRQNTYEPMSVLKGPDDFVNTAPAIANGFIFAGSDDSCVYAWDIRTGKMVWKHKTEGKVRSSPAIAKGRLFIGSDDGNVYCFSNQ